MGNLLCGVKALHMQPLHFRKGARQGEKRQKTHSVGGNVGLELPTTAKRFSPMALMPISA
jgi:hypothetical protein